MSVWRIEFNPEHLYFITTRAIKRAHLFQRDVMKQNTTKKQLMG